MSENASATYRGFRNQALYALYRLLTDTSASDRIYRPEGAEDLAVFDSRMLLVEAVQVKDYSSDLTLSALKPKSDIGFFGRFRRRMTEHPDCVTKLAIFGQLGPELDGAINNQNNKESTQRAKVVEKLCGDNPVISVAEANVMLDRLRGNIVYPSADNLMSAVTQSLQETNAAGELECSIGLLMQWVFEASEQQRDLTRQGLLLQLERIGIYLAALRDTSAQWSVSISPVRSLILSKEDQMRLTTEYRQGIQARWEHIEAGADCARIEQLQKIHQQFQRWPVVIVRGASGQGKSTLGWRYLHDFCADGVRFHIKLVEGREHAMRIANALGAHVRRLNLKAFAYLDVSPADTGWSALVRELVASGLKVLIAVREEDFRRANIAVGDFAYSEVVLDRITKEEAEPIFSALHVNPAVNNALDFEETWTRFAAEDGGPLLEFTHLVSAGESLISRITSQIRRIQKDAVAKVNGLTEAHLELLALAAVANETGARVSLAKLCDSVKVNPLMGPLGVLEDEYLLRVQDENGSTSVTGLHALRSKAVVKALFSELPERWGEYAIRVLALILDEDVESFLLAVFSQRPDFADKLIQHIHTLPLRSWIQAACITNALIWEGVSRYETKNRATILAAINKYGIGWWLVCDSFVGMSGDSGSEILGALNETLKADVKAISLTPKVEVFDIFTTWASGVSAPPAPHRPREWVGAGDVAFWLGHTGTGCPLRIAIEALLPQPLPIELSVEDLGRLVSGRARIADAPFADWHDTERQNIIQKFLCETDSVHVVDDGHEVKVYYSVPLADSVTMGMPDANDWNEQTMKRIRLLRLLFPNRDIFGAQGIGLESFVKQIGHDPTFKRIPVKSLPMDRSVRLNAIFGNIVAYRHNRPNTWAEYANAALAFREAVSACFRKLHRGWNKLLSESPPKGNTITQLPGAEIERLQILSKLPMFPRSAVDEWGFLSEEKENKETTIETMQQRSLRRFNAWRKAFRDFESSVGMVVGKIIDLTVLYAAEHKGHVANVEDDKTANLFLLNLGNAWEALRPMQREFRERFGGICSQQRLDELEKHERSNFQHLWPVGIAMRYERQRHFSNAGLRIQGEIVERRSLFLQTLRAEVSAVLDCCGTASVRETPWIIGNTPHLCIVVDYKSIDSIEVTTPRVMEAIWRAAQKGAWRTLESTPLEVEWPKVALVNLVCGKALLPVCATVSTAIFFASSKTFEAKPFHHLPLPVESEDFTRGGFSLWESPLLRSVLTLQGQLVAFAMTNIRFYQLSKLVHEYELTQDDTDRITASFRHELRIVLTEAQRGFAQAIQVLETAACENKERWKRDLQRLCQSLLFDVNEDASITINQETFISWMNGHQTANEECQTIISNIVAFALTKADEAPPLPREYKLGQAS